MLSASTTPDTLAAPLVLAHQRAVQIIRGRPAFEDHRLAEKFEDEDRILTLRNVRNLCWIAMMLVPAAVVLDWFAYRDLLVEFALLRLTCTVCLAIILFTSRTAIGHRYYRALTVIVPMTPAFFISLMIKQAHDPGSGYYAGLTLCLVAIGFMFHWTFRESAIALSLTIAFYLAANMEALRDGIPSTTMAAFVNNCVFILLNGVVILCGSFYHHRIRVREFLNRIEVEEQREELEARNGELTSALRQLHETESQLFQSEKLASLGRMSAGIIHEINNPLNFTNQALYVLKKKSRHMPESEREHFDRIITDIKEGIGRVSSIVTDLRSFSHPDSSSAHVVDVYDAVQNAVRLMGKELKDAGVDLEAEMPRFLHVMGDRNQIIQILINLIQNAIDATKATEQPCITITAQEDPSRIAVQVTDNGCGIPPENLPKVFDPFFTTKDVGEGMGMGLSVSYRMMHQMRGGIDVASEPGTGTTFTLWFPPPSPTLVS
jgi:two-component system sensor histidine kinase PhcS